MASKPTASPATPPARPAALRPRGNHTVPVELQQTRAFETAIDRRRADTRQTTDALIESARARFLEQFPAALKQAARRVAIKALGFNGPVVLSGPVAGVALVVASLGFVGAGGLAYARGERAGYERGVLAARAEAVSKPPAPAAKGR